MIFSDPSEQAVQSWSSQLPPSIDIGPVAVTMGCGDGCPLAKAKRREEWQIPDPKEMPPEWYCEVRDLIERKVKELLLRWKQGLSVRPSGVARCRK